MLKIRLARGGRKKLPFYRITVTNVTSPRDSKYLERIGTYNPMLTDDKENRVTLDKERAEYWISVGAQPTEKVAKFMIALGVNGAEKFVPNFKPKNKGDGLKKKALEKIAKEKEAAEEAAEAAKVAQEAAIAEATAAKEAAEAEAQAAKEAAAAAKEAEKAVVEAPAPAAEAPVEKAEEAPAPEAK